MIDAEYQIFFLILNAGQERKSQKVRIGLVGISPSPQMESVATIEGFCQSLTRKQDRIPKKLLPIFSTASIDHVLSSFSEFRPAKT